MLVDNKQEKMHNLGSSVTINPFHFWQLTAAIGVFTSLHGFALWFFEGVENLTVLFAINTAWAIISLVLLPVFSKFNLHSISILFVVIVGFSTPLYFFESNPPFTTLFRNYLLISGILIFYSCFKQMRILSDYSNDAIVTDNKVVKLTGSNIYSWLYRICLAFYISSFFYSAVTITSSSSLFVLPVGFFSSNSPIIFLAVLTCLIIGTFWEKRLLVGFGAILNIIFLIGFIYDHSSAALKHDFFDIVGSGSYLGFSASMTYIIVIACSYLYENKNADTPDPDIKSLVQTNTKFSLGWLESFAFIISFILLSVMFCAVPTSQKIRDAIRNSNVDELRQLINRNGSINVRSLLSDAIRSHQEKIIEVLIENGLALEDIILNQFDLHSLIMHFDDDFLLRLTKKGLDLSRPEYLRYLAASVGRHSEQSIDKIKFFLNLAKENKVVINDYYLPDSTASSFHTYSFNNPLAIAVEKRNADLARFFHNYGFRIDDEVVAASIRTHNFKDNPVAPYLQIRGYPKLQKPLNFELISQRLNMVTAKYWLTCGIDLAETDADENNIFHAFAISRVTSNGTIHILNEALTRGIDINALNLKGETPLWRSLKNNNFEQLSVLIEIGANLDTPSPSGYELRDYLEKNNLFTMLEYLD